MKKTLLFTICLAFLSLYRLQAQSVSLDPSFSDDGKLKLGWDIFGWRVATSVTTQPDGKILIAGLEFSEENNSDFAIARLLPNGSPDPTFGPGGTIFMDMGSDEDWASDIIVQPDEKIIVIGRSKKPGSPNAQLVVARFLPNGTADAAFGIQGISRTIVEQGDHASKILLQPDGKIVVASNFSANTGFGFFRFNTDGTLDDSFGQGGRMVHHLNFFQSQLAAIALKPDGKLVATGYSNTSTASNNFLYFITQYNSDGSPDTLFGTNGVVNDHYSATGKFSYGASICVLPDGKILIAGSETGPSYVTQFGMAQYNPEGVLDPLFGIGGKVSTEIPERSGGISNILRQSDNSYIAVGSSSRSDFSEPKGYTIARFLPSGAPDSLFAVNGFASDIFEDSTDVSYFWDATLQPDGKILGVMTLDYWETPKEPVGILRFLSDLKVGALDFDALNKSLFLYPNPIAQHATLEFTLDKAQEISVCLYDMQGKLLETIVNDIRYNAGEHAIPISLSTELPSGSYVISIVSAGKRVGVKVLK